MIQALLIDNKWANELHSRTATEYKKIELRPKTDPVKQISKLLKTNVVEKAPVTLQDMEFVAYYDPHAPEQGLPASTLTNNDGLNMFGDVILVCHDAQGKVVTFDEPRKEIMQAYFDLQY